MIINCKIIQIDADVNVTYINGSVHRHQSVWITPVDAREKINWVSLVELRDEKIEEFTASGHKVNDIVPVRFKPDYYRVKSGGQETGEYRSLCYMDFYYGGQNNG